MKYQYKILSSSISDIPVIIVEGDLTSDAGVDLKNTYNDIKNSLTLKKIIIDFEKCKYINSSGIASLISIIQTTNEVNGKTIFVGLSDHLNKVMEIVGLTDFVEILKNIDEAIKA